MHDPFDHCNVKTKVRVKAVGYLLVVTVVDTHTHPDMMQVPVDFFPQSIDSTVQYCEIFMA